MSYELPITDTLISTVAGGSPANQAITLAYAKAHIRALGTYDDTLIGVYIDAAASYFEEQTGRQILNATREAWLDRFPFLGASGECARIELPHPPLLTVVSVNYIDADGVLQEFNNAASPSELWRYSAPAGPYCHRGFVEPKYGYSWPIARLETGAVRIQYTCGYGATADAVPPLVRGILCYLVDHFFNYRGAVAEARKGQILELPYGVQMMMDGFKYSAFPSQVLRPYAYGRAYDYGGRIIL